MARIDFHVHPGWNNSSPRVILDKMDKASIDKAVLLSVDLDPRQLGPYIKENNIYDNNAVNSTKQLFSIIDKGMTNNHSMAFYNEAPDRFIPFASVAPTHPEEVVGQCLQAFKDSGFMGLKFLPTLQFFHPDPEADANMAQIYEFAEANKMPILMHTGCDPGIWEDPRLCDNSNPKHLEKVVERYPELYIVTAHAGAYSADSPGIFLEENIALMKKSDRVFTDISAVSMHSGIVKKLIEEAGHERVLFGSDSPAVEGYDMPEAAKDIDGADYLTGEQKAAIMGGNAERFLGLFKE